MKKTYYTILMAVIGLAALSGCLSQTDDKVTPVTSEEIVKGYKDITSTELKTMMADEDIFLVDTHIPEQRHIKGTDEVIPFNEIEANLDRLPADRDSKIVVYCRSGSMSAAASKTLVELGYTDVNNLLGGANDWMEHGYEFME